MRNKENKVRNIQRIFLDDSHIKKANCQFPKKMMPTPEKDWHLGSAVRLAPKFDQMSNVEHVCEGVETGLSILSQAPVFTNMNCCLAGNNLSQFMISDKTKQLVIWADHDEAIDKNGSKINIGLEHALLLKSRAEKLGIHVSIITPSKIGDWLDYPEQCKQEWLKLLQTITHKAS